MKKEILKGFMMVLLIVVMALANAAVSNAQAVKEPAKQISAAIPFEFSIDYKTMPAGTYVFQTVATAGDALLIQNVDGTTSALRHAGAIESRENKSPSKSLARLVFHRYGQRYFLAEVWNGSGNGDRDGWRLMKSEAERALESELASLSLKSELAGNSYEAIEVLASLR